MRILYIDHYAGSARHGMEFRPFYLGREWQRHGHEVTVLAASFSHLRQQNPPGTATWSEERIEGVRYVWLRTPEYSGNGAGRVRNMLSFVLALRHNRRRLAEEFAPNVVIASSTYPFDMFSARWIARRTRARLIFELHDLWPLSPMELGGYSRWHPFIMATQYAEDYVCRHTDVLVSLLPKALDHLASRGLDPAKFRYVPNGVVLDEWQPQKILALPEQHARLIRRERERGRFVVVYAGAHGLLNNLDLVLSAAAALRNEPVSFVLVGQGPEKAPLQRRAEEAGLDSIAFLPPVPKLAVPSVLAAADLLFLSFAPQPLFRFGVSPNKLIDYMMSGKPILAAMRAGNNPVEEHGCGVTVAPDDAQAVAASVLKMRALPPAERQAMGARGRRAAEEIYSYEALAASFAENFPADR